MDSWRISIKQINRSSSVSLAVGKTGAMVLSASRGPASPVFFSTGQTQRIIDMFGTPAVGNETVWDAVEYNREAPLWIASTSVTGDKTDGVKFTATTAVPFTASAGIPAASVVDPAYTPYGTLIVSPAITDYFVLASKFPSTASYLKFTASFVLNATTASLSIFTINVYILRGVNYELYDTYKVSVDPAAKGDYGVSAYVLDVFKNHDFLRAWVNTSVTPATITTFVTPITTATAMTGGAKTTPVAADVIASWTNWTQAGRYPTDIFMDPTSMTGIPAKFDTLSGIHKYADFIFVLPLAETAATAVATKTGYTIDNRNVHFHMNWANITDGQTGNIFNSNLVGRTGLKYAAMSDSFNALSPSWADENGHGGQLGSGIDHFLLNPMETELQILDAGGINCRIMHNVYGPLISSDKTGKNPGTLSHDSFIGTSRLFNFIMKNIVDQVLTFQITKLNDGIHRRLAVQKAKLILDPIKAAGFLDDYVIVCDESNNDSTARTLRQFKFALAVWPTPNSQGIDFSFVKASASTSVTSAFLGL